MPARDFYHNHVKQALIKDGWMITHDPLTLEWTNTSVQLDLGAERLLAAEKGTRKIAVEVKSFLSASALTDLYGALGQFILYRKALGKTEPERRLFLAIHQPAYLNLFTHPDSADLRAEEGINLLVFDPDTQEILQWIE
ncbi:MAG: element excision factor XisH family protein [Blastocatellia bacterium]